MFRNIYLNLRHLVLKVLGFQFCTLCEQYHWDIQVKGCPNAGDYLSLCKVCGAGCPKKSSEKDICIGCFEDGHVATCEIYCDQDRYAHVK